MAQDPPLVIHSEDVDPVACPCGESRRILRGEDGVAIGVHVTDLDGARAHYHKQTCEVYYILEGEGEIEIGDSRYPVRPGHVVYIPANQPHRAIGAMRAVIVTLPPFDADDEYMFD